MTEHELRDRAEILRLIHFTADLPPSSGARIVVVTIPGEPLPKARARTGKARHHYTPRRTESAEAAASMLLKVALGGVRFERNVALAAIYYRPDRRVMDGDNLEKLIKDAATKAGAWWDDCQVTAWCGRIELDPERPRLVLALAETTSTLWREPPKPQARKPSAPNVSRLLARYKGRVLR